MNKNTEKFIVRRWAEVKTRQQWSSLWFELEAVATCRDDMFDDVASDLFFLSAIATTRNLMLLEEAYKHLEEVAA